MPIAKRRWARTHYELHKLKAFTFTADIIEGKREDGTIFMVAKNVFIHCTGTTHGLHTSDTDSTQKPPCTATEPEPAPSLQHSAEATAQKLP